MRILSEACMLLIAFCLYWCNRERRRYLKKRIGSKAPLNVYQAARNMGFMLTKKDLEIKGDTTVLRNGAILYSFHFGVWELMPCTLRRLGYDLGVVVNRYGGGRRHLFAEFFDKFLYKFRSTGNIGVFYKEDTMKMVRFVKDGGLLGMLVDGNTFYSKFEKAQKLSRLNNLPLVPFAAYRKNGTGILEINCDLEKRVKERPLDYMWFYRSRIE